MDASTAPVMLFFFCSIVHNTNTLDCVLVKHITICGKNMLKPKWIEISQISQLTDMMMVGQPTCWAESEVRLQCN